MPNLMAIVMPKSGLPSQTLTARIFGLSAHSLVFIGLIHKDICFYLIRFYFCKVSNAYLDS